MGRPRANLEEVVRAMILMLRIGCPWRDLPCGATHWRTVYGYFMRWRRAGLWTRILQDLTKRAKGRLCFIDGSYIRVHQNGSNPRGGQAAQAIGTSRGGLTTKIHALVDGRGRALKLLLSAGNVVDIKMAPALVADLDRKSCGTLVADKGYDSDALRALLVEKDIFPCLGVSRKRRESRPFHRGYYRHRHHVENFFARIKRHHRVATRYDKLAASFLAFVALSAILHWIE
jgi:transposase